MTRGLTNQQDTPRKRTTAFDCDDQESSAPLFNAYRDAHFEKIVWPSQPARAKRPFEEETRQRTLPMVQGQPESTLYRQMRYIYTHFDEIEQIIAGNSAFYHTHTSLAGLKKLFEENADFSTYQPLCQWYVEEINYALAAIQIGKHAPRSTYINLAFCHLTDIPCERLQQRFSHLFRHVRVLSIAGNWLENQNANEILAKLKPSSVEPLRYSDVLLPETQAVAMEAMETDNETVRLTHNSLHSSNRL